MANSRKSAAIALTEALANGAYSNITLNEVFAKSPHSAQERALTSAIFYGTLDRKITVDYVIAKFLNKPLSKISPFTLSVLRISVYQIMFMDSIPPSAAVNEAVKLIKSSKERYNASFVNAVLRNILRNPVEIPNGNSIKALSIRFSCPEWIIESFISDYGKDTAISLLEESLKAPHMVLRVNTCRISPEKLVAQLSTEGITAVSCELQNALEIVGGMDVRECECYKKGLFHIQDRASQRAIELLDLKPNERVLDICSAPGGKSFTAAEIMKNKGEVFSFDLYESRVELIKKGVLRLGLSSITADTFDATVKKIDIGLFDAVICDVPCSGLGVLRRKPDIKYKDISDLPSIEDIQDKMLANAASYVKTGGRLLYSTCTLRKAENEERIKAFLDKTADYELQYQHSYMPHIDKTDGFFCALLVKKG